MTTLEIVLIAVAVILVMFVSWGSWREISYIDLAAIVLVWACILSVVWLVFN